MDTRLDQKRIIGENIKAARKIKGLSQRALAEKLNIAFQNLSVWENGKGAPSAKYLMKLAEILEISLDQLTSPAGFITSGDQSRAMHGFGVGQTSIPTGQYTYDLQKSIQNELPKVMQQMISDNHSLKLIVAYLEEILSLLRAAPSPGIQFRAAAESRDYGAYTRPSVRIPLPPVDIPTDERIKWEHNAASLLRWTHSPQALWVPGWVMEKFCRENDITSIGDNMDEITKIIKEYLEQGKSA